LHILVFGGEIVNDATSVVLFNALPPHCPQNFGN
jgi:hypothetical protein